MKHPQIFDCRDRSITLWPYSYL